MSHDAHLDEEQLAALAFEASDEHAAHLAGCPRCASELAAQRALLSELEALPPIQPPGELVSRVRREIVGAMRAEREADAPARPRALAGWFTAGVVAVVGVIALLVLGDFSVLASMDALAVARWALALAVLGGAIAIARLAPRSSQNAALGLGGALGAAVGLGLLDVLSTHEGLGEHLGCEKIMMLAALAPATAALLVLRRSGGKDARGAMLEAAAGGAAGALAGQAALFTTCSSPEGLVHVVVFHLLTFLGIVTASALLGRLTFGARASA